MRCLALALMATAVGLGASAGPSRAEPIRFCARATAIMPTAEDHRGWLEQNARYGPGAAAEFADRMKRFGPNVLNYQIIIHEELSASGWFDAEGYNGLHEAKVTTIKKLSCGRADYPVALMVGLQAESMSRSELLVSKKPGLYDVISLARLPEDKAVPVRLAGSRELICLDIRSCVGISSHPQFR